MSRRSDGPTSVPPGLKDNDAAGPVEIDALVPEPLQMTEQTDLAVATLNRMRRRPAGEPAKPKQPVESVRSSRRFGEPAYSGPAPDERDPQGLASGISRLLVDRGWSTSAAIGSLTARWTEVVGPEVAAHCVIESFDPRTTELVLRTDATAWMIQLRAMLPSIRENVDAMVGRGVVANISVVGPVQPKTFRGPRRLKGRGARDTWG